MQGIFENSECTIFKAGDVLEGSRTTSLHDILVILSAAKKC